jgi:1-pyrroline-2-carboxylate reductase [NAD(P)H]
MKIISAQEVHAALTYPELIVSLKDAFANSFVMPPRQVFLLDQESGAHDAFALLPSWNQSVIAVKTFTYFPGNKLPKKTLYSKIMLFDRHGGEPIALVDGTSCTFFRTAGVSALASSFLSRTNASVMLLLGTGNLASFLVKAHASVRPLKKVFIWGRTRSKAERVAIEMMGQLNSIEFVVADDIESACSQADIIVSATGSHDILVKGAWVRPGTHTDFLGNHHPDKRECDTELVIKSSVYVDTYANCYREAGEILLPIAEGRFSKTNVKGELADLCTGKSPQRTTDSEITLFKSVGSALSDLVAAYQAYSHVVGRA